MDHIRSVDPVDCDFEDLDPLLRAIDGAEVVLLGELSHGDGSAQNAKEGRIIKCLIERLDFNAIGWEAGTYDCWTMSRALENGVPPAIALQGGLYGVWHNKETLLSHHTSSPAAAHRPAGRECRVRLPELVADRSQYGRKAACDLGSVRSSRKRFRAARATCQRI